MPEDLVKFISATNLNIVNSKVKVKVHFTFTFDNKITILKK